MVVPQTSMTLPKSPVESAVFRAVWLEIRGVALEYNLCNCFLLGSPCHPTLFFFDILGVSQFRIMIISDWLYSQSYFGSEIDHVGCPSDNWFVDIVHDLGFYHQFLARPCSHPPDKLIPSHATGTDPGHSTNFVCYFHLPSDVEARRLICFDATCCGRKMRKQSHVRTKMDRNMSHMEAS